MRSLCNGQTIGSSLPSAPSTLELTPIYPEKSPPSPSGSKSPSPTPIYPAMESSY